MDEDNSAIGARVRAVRRRRGMSLATAAPLAGISKGQLSKLETGKAEFTRRGLIENLAYALDCSPRDLTAEPTPWVDRRAAVAASAIPLATGALHDSTLDEVPDVPARPLPQLVDLADRAHAAADDVRYELVAGNVLGQLLTELHVHAATGDGGGRQAALEALVKACIVTRSLAGTLGYAELAVTATRRGWDAARAAERLDLAGFMAMGRAATLNRIGSRHRANLVLADALTAAQDVPGPTVADTRNAEARGILHLMAGLLAARSGIAADADTHLEEAADLAAFTGERNHMLYHFGPANVHVWELAVAVELERGPEVAERVAPVLDMSALGSAERRSAANFDLARSYVQGGGARDAEALRHMDQADRIAPGARRQDPLARELIEGLDRRGLVDSWELNSLKNRFGISA